MVAAVEEWRRSSTADSVEVAFYGGTFTSLSREVQESLLSPLQPLLQQGVVSSIRVSTRPDALDLPGAGFLRDAGVRLVELGVQSMDDSVLDCAGRGHTAAHTLEAFALLRSMGLGVGAQLMPGLPGESPDGGVESLRRLLPVQPELLRIYPAVVLKGTELAGLYRAGRYLPLSLADAVHVCKVMLQMAAQAGMPVIRAGLHPGDDLAAGGEILAGPYHPAFRQLAEGERWYDLLRLECAAFAPGDELEVFVAPSRISDVVGQKRCNLRRIEELSLLRLRSVKADHSLADGELILVSGSKVVRSHILNGLHYNSSMNAVKEPS
jgi:histone acetyltransferase (RNA polymerase elongator complex component)